MSPSKKVKMHSPWNEFSIESGQIYARFKLLKVPTCGTALLVDSGSWHGLVLNLVATAAVVLAVFVEVPEHSGQVGDVGALVRPGQLATLLAENPALPAQLWLSGDHGV